MKKLSIPEVRVLMKEPARAQEWADYKNARRQWLFGVVGPSTSDTDQYGTDMRGQVPACQNRFAWKGGR